MVPTGGFGAHFNATKTPHWRYLLDALVQEGVPRAAIEVPGLESANTVQDALMIVDYAHVKGAVEFAVVTSEVHIERCRYIFRALDQDLRPEFIGAEQPSDTASKSHEARAIKQLKDQGGVFVGDRFFPHPNRTFQ